MKLLDHLNHRFSVLGGCCDGAVSLDLGWGLAHGWEDRTTVESRTLVGTASSIDTPLSLNTSQTSLKSKHFGDFKILALG